jgi:hypothetical protein
MELSGDLDMLSGEQAELGCWWCAAKDLRKALT